MVITMTNGLGRLEPVDPRDVWPSEAHDFTPWLLANAQALSEAVGMDLDLEAAEHPIGGFSLDLIGVDTATGGRVIVENQLEASDHSHLGQILTYAGGTQPENVLWLATSFREEHRAALEWLNERPMSTLGFLLCAYRLCGSGRRRQRRCSHWKFNPMIGEKSPRASCDSWIQVD